MSHLKEVKMTKAPHVTVHCSCTWSHTKHPVLILMSNLQVWGYAVFPVIFTTAHGYYPTLTAWATGSASVYSEPSLATYLNTYKLFNRAEYSSAWPLACPATVEGSKLAFPSLFVLQYKKRVKKKKNTCCFTCFGPFRDPVPSTQCCETSRDDLCCCYKCQDGRLSWC